jgi:perosamine synthetase
LKKLDIFNKKKEFLINIYIKKLANNNYILPLLNYETNKSSYWLFGIRVDINIRDKLIIFLKKYNIATGVHFYPMTLQPIFKKYRGRCQNSEKIWMEIITLPLHYDLSRNDINFITKKINSFFKIDK